MANTKKKTTKKKTTKKSTVKKTTPVVTSEQLKAEADKIATEMLRSQGFGDLLDKKQEEPTPEDTTSKVDAFLKSLEQDVAETDIPLDWQPIMNVLTRMYEAGEDQYNNVKFYKSKGIIVTLDKKQYNNSQQEFQRIKFNLNYGSLKYDMQEDDSKTVIRITLA